LTRDNDESKTIPDSNILNTKDREERPDPQPPSSTMPSNSSSSSASSIAPALGQAYAVEDSMATIQANVEQTIDKLFRLSAVIRSAGMSYRYAKAANFVEYDKDVNLTQKFREGVELLFKHKDFSPSSYLSKRLVESICLRQRQLAYSQRQKMGQGGGKIGERTDKFQGIASLPPRSELAFMRQGGSIATVSKAGMASKLRETTGAEDLVPSPVYTATYVPTNISFRTNRVAAWTSAPKFGTIDDSLENLPSPPETWVQKPEIVCPYCAIPYEKTKFKGPTWRYYNHLLFLVSSRFKTVHD